MKNKEITNSSICEFLIYVNNTENIKLELLEVFITLAQEIQEKQQLNVLTHQTIAYMKIALVEVEKNEMLLLKDFKVFHLWFALNILLQISSYEELIEKYYFILSKFTDLKQWHNMFNLTKIASNNNFGLYVTTLGKYLFDDTFYENNAAKQQANIYCFFNLTMIHWPMSIDYRKYMYPLVYNIFLKALDIQNSELVFSLHLPLMYSLNGNATIQSEMKEFNEQVDKKLELYIKNVIISKYNIVPIIKKRDTKIVRVAFLQERIIEYSVHKVFYSLLENLAKIKDIKYEFIVLDLNFKEFGGSVVESVKKLKKLGFEYVDLHKECKLDETSSIYSIIDKSLLIREYIINKKVDILIGQNGGPEYNFLFTTRTCPTQIYWSHGNFEYDIDGIDMKICHFNPKIQNIQYKHFNIPPDIARYNPIVDTDLVRQIKSTFPKNSFILGSIGRLIKLDNNDYLQTIAKVMNKNPHTIYLVCGSGDQESIKKKVSLLGLEKRFYFTGVIDSKIYGHVLDLFLSPFPYGGGEALDEYRYKGKSYVAMHYQDWLYNISKLNFWKEYKDNNKQIMNKSFYNKKDLKNIHKNNYLSKENKSVQFYHMISNVVNRDDYLNVTNRIINDKEFASKIKEERQFIVRHTKYDSDNFIKLLNKNIKERF